jgi:hypothetical protein
MDRKKLRWLLVGVGITAVAYVSLVLPTAQINNPNGNASAAVPAPTPIQKKVVLKNLGMA